MVATVLLLRGLSLIWRRCHRCRFLCGRFSVSIYDRESTTISTPFGLSNPFPELSKHGRPAFRLGLGVYAVRVAVTRPPKGTPASHQEGRFFGSSRTPKCYDLNRLLFLRARGRPKTRSSWLVLPACHFAHRINRSVTSSNPQFTGTYITLNMHAPLCFFAFSTPQVA